MSKLFTLLLLGFWLFWADVPVQAQAQPSSNATPTSVQASSSEVSYLRLILEEVRLLRMSQQQMMGNTLRRRTLAEQFSRQQVAVETMSEQITQLKALISQAYDGKRGEDELQEMEAQIRETSDPQERDRRQRDYAAYKRIIERERVTLQKEAVEQLARQTQLENSLRLEQAKLAELQGQLDMLDQEMERLIVETKPRK